jgi:hypothetical protein
LKIRDGFVSNSSSTSFSIYGINIDGSKLRSLLCGGPEEDFPDDDGIYELLENLEGLNTYHDYESGGAYIGLPWDSIKDNETGKEFKNRVHDLIREQLHEDLTCSTISETISS